MLYPLSYGGPGRSKTLPVGGSSQPPLAGSALRLVASRGMSSSLGRVLVVDDDDVIRQLITVNLELEGFEVHTAVDGQDCLDKVKDVRPDVITLDIMMPRLDGWEAASRLRADPDTEHVKVVLLSARAQEADLARSIAQSQTAETTTMARMLAARGGTPLPAP